MKCLKPQVLYVGFSDDGSDTDEGDEEMVIADDEELEDEVADDEAVLDSHDDSHDSTGINVYTILARNIDLTIRCMY